MAQIKIILNPVAGRGFSLKVEPEIIQYLDELKCDYELVHTEEIGHAITLAEQAVMDGFKTVVAVGGDGTTNEVVNGLMHAAQKGKEGTLGLIATGSGSDFTYNVGLPSDIKEACQRIKNGENRKVDIGRFMLPGQPPRYFANQLGIGFDGTVTVVAKRYKRLRGMALYLPVVLNSIFITNKATKVSIQCDNQRIDLTTVQISIANGGREGGGFFMAPDAKVDDGLFDIVIVEDVSKLTMLALVPQFMSGKHVNHKKTKVLRTRQIQVTSEDNLIAHFDGELLCTEGHEIHCEIFPRCLSVIK
ncbi:diacylglycerol kinase family lipid kinase [bacterium]|nr:diacylglycerol kinase family lipid kinase [bacterium]